MVTVLELMQIAIKKKNKTRKQNSLLSNSIKESAFNSNTKCEEIIRSLYFLIGAGKIDKLDI